MAVTRQHGGGKPWYTLFDISQAWGQNGEQGVDITTPFHTQITAPYGGKVTRTGCYDYGCEVDIAAYVPGLGNVTEYIIHLDEIAAGIVRGATVGAGQVLGLSGGETTQQVAAGLDPGAMHPVHNPVGKPPYSTGPHTEVGFVTNNATPFTASAKTVNPVPYLNAAASGNTGGKGGGGACYAPCMEQALLDGMNLADAQNVCAGCADTPDPGKAVSGLGGDIAAGISGGLADAGNKLLAALGVSGAGDLAWRVVLFGIGGPVLAIALFKLFEPDLKSAAGTAVKVVK